MFDLKFVAHAKSIYISCILFNIFISILYSIEKISLKPNRTKNQAAARHFHFHFHSHVFEIWIWVCYCCCMAVVFLNVPLSSFFSRPLPIYFVCFPIFNFVIDDLPDRNCSMCEQCCINYDGWLRFQNCLYNVWKWCFW